MRPGKGGQERSFAALPGLRECMQCVSGYVAAVAGGAIGVSEWIRVGRLRPKRKSAFSRRPSFLGLALAGTGCA
jgi:hypothetical protein